MQNWSCVTVTRIMCQWMYVCKGEAIMKEDINSDIKGFKWGKWKHADDLWVLTNRYENFCYLILGSERALLIDTGCGEGNLRQIVESITDLEVLVVNTHGHFDHTSGNGWWEKAYCGSYAAEDSDFSCPLEAMEAKEKQPYFPYIFETVGDGDSFDLGNRTVEVISVPAHARSSIALLDKKGGRLFTGDELEAGQVLLMLGYPGLTQKQVVERHLENMRKLKAREGEYSVICPAHNGVFLSKDYLEDFLELDRRILEGTAEYADTAAGFRWGGEQQFSSQNRQRRAVYGKASIILYDL